VLLPTASRCGGQVDRSLTLQSEYCRFESATAAYRMRENGTGRVLARRSALMERAQDWLARFQDNLNGWWVHLRLVSATRCISVSSTQNRSAVASHATSSHRRDITEILLKAPTNTTHSLTHSLTYTHARRHTHTPTHTHTRTHAHTQHTHTHTYTHTHAHTHTPPPPLYSIQHIYLFLSHGNLLGRATYSNAMNRCA